MSNDTIKMTPVRVSDPRTQGNCSEKNLHFFRRRVYTSLSPSCPECSFLDNVVYLLDSKPSLIFAQNLMWTNGILTRCMSFESRPYYCIPSLIFTHDMLCMPAIMIIWIIVWCNPVNSAKETLKILYLKNNSLISIFGNFLSLIIKIRMDNPNLIYLSLYFWDVGGSSILLIYPPLLYYM